jgi:hypothetical protein
VTSHRAAPKAPTCSLGIPDSIKNNPIKLGFLNFSPFSGDIIVITIWFLIPQIVF